MSLSKLWLEVLAVLAGIAVAVILIAFGESLAHLIHPPPGGEYTDREHLRQMMADVPTLAFVVILTVWFVGTSVGAWTAGRLTPVRSMRAALIVGGVMLAAGILNLGMIPHPLWVTVLGVLVFPLGGWLGARAALKSEPSIVVD